jgi:hypothetical protein
VPKFIARVERPHRPPSGHASLTYPVGAGAGRTVTRRLTVIAAVLASALAGRATAAPACGVTITSEPDDVRAVEEQAELATFQPRVMALVRYLLADPPTFAGSP